MSKKYRLLRDVDSPNLKAKADTIGEADLNSGKVWFGEDKNFFYDLATVLSSPEWFEEIKEEVKEEQPVIKYSSEATQFIMNNGSKEDDKWYTLPMRFEHYGGNFWRVHPKEEQPFQWTEQSVSEFVRHLCKNASPLKNSDGSWRVVPYTNDGRTVFSTEQMMKKFTESKQQPKPERDWEIVAYREKNALQTVWTKENTVNDGLREDFQNVERWTGTITGHSFEVFSVKRISDSEVFSVGDEVLYAPVGEISWKIDHFFIRYDGELLVRSKNCANVELFGKDLMKVPQPESSATSYPTAGMRFTIGDDPIPKMVQYVSVSSDLVKFIGGVSFTISDFNEKLNKGEINRWYSEEVLNNRSEEELQSQSSAKKERVEVSSIIRLGGGIDDFTGKPISEYRFKTFQRMPDDKFPAIKEAIEKILNQ